MKYKIIFGAILLIILNCYNTQAADFAMYTKIAAIDKELNQAKTVEEIKAVAVKMYGFVLENLGDSFPPPFSDATFKIWNKLWCGDIASKAKVPSYENKYFEYVFEKKLWQMAGVLMGIDNDETIKKKIQTWWSKYKKKCTCDSLTFNIPNGNILKYSISKNTTVFLETLVLNYDLDINFIDPVDGRNLLDYIIDEIEKMKITGVSKSSIGVFEKYRDSIISIGGKPSK